MHRLLRLLERAAAGLDRRGRRIVLFAAATALSFFAHATAAAGQAGDYAGAAMSAALMLFAALLAALAWSVRRGAGHS